MTEPSETPLTLMAFCGDISVGLAPEIKTFQDAMAFSCSLETRLHAAERERDEARQDERWLREMLADYRVPFDDHAVGRRIALNQFIHDLRDERGEAIKESDKQTEIADAMTNYMPDAKRELALEQRRKELEQVIAHTNGLNYCNDCNSPLSACGEPNPDGTPSEDCLVCIIRSQRDQWHEVASELAAGCKEAQFLLEIMPSFMEPQDGSPKDMIDKALSHFGAQEKWQP